MSWTSKWRWPEHPPGRLAHDGEGLDQQVVEGLALVEALPELDRLVGERLVAQALHLGLEGADRAAPARPAA